MFHVNHHATLFFHHLETPSEREAKRRRARERAESYQMKRESETDFKEIHKDIDSAAKELFHKSVKLHSEGKTEKAVAEISCAIKMDQTKYVLYFNRAVFHASLGNNLLALQDMTNAILVRQGKSVLSWDEVNHSQDIPLLETSDTSMRLERAKILVVLNDNRGIRECTTLLSYVTDPAQRSNLFMLLGYLNEAHYDHPKALDNFVKAKQLDPNNPEVLLKCAYQFSMHHDYEKASIDVEHALKLEQSVDTYHCRGELSLRARDFVGALNAQQKALQLSKHSLERSMILNSIANIYFIQGRYADAEEYFEKAFAADENRRDDLGKFCIESELHPQYLYPREGKHEAMLLQGKKVTVSTVSAPKEEKTVAIVHLSQIPKLKGKQKEKKLDTVAERKKYSTLRLKMQDFKEPYQDLYRDELKLMKESLLLREVKRLAKGNLNELSSWFEGLGAISLNATEQNYGVQLGKSSLEMQEWANRFLQTFWGESKHIEAARILQRNKIKDGIFRPTHSAVGFMKIILDGQSYYFVSLSHAKDCWAFFKVFEKFFHGYRTQTGENVFLISEDRSFDYRKFQREIVSSVICSKEEAPERLCAENYLALFITKLFYQYGSRIEIKDILIATLYPYQFTNKISKSETRLVDPPDRWLHRKRHVKMNKPTDKFHIYTMECCSSCTQNRPALFVMWANAKEAGEANRRSRAEKHSGKERSLSPIRDRKIREHLDRKNPSTVASVSSSNFVESKSSRSEKKKIPRIYPVIYTDWYVTLPANEASLMQQLNAIKDCQERKKEDVATTYLYGPCVRNLLLNKLNDEVPQKQVPCDHMQLRTRWSIEDPKLKGLMKEGKLLDFPTRVEFKRESYSCSLETFQAHLGDASRHDVAFTIDTLWVAQVEDKKGRVLDSLGGRAIEDFESARIATVDENTADYFAANPRQIFRVIHLLSITGWIPPDKIVLAIQRNLETLDEFIQEMPEVINEELEQLLLNKKLALSNFNYLKSILPSPSPEGDICLLKRLFPGLMMTPSADAWIKDILKYEYTTLHALYAAIIVNIAMQTPDTFISECIKQRNLNPIFAAYFKDIPDNLFINFIWQSQRGLQYILEREQKLDAPIASEQMLMDSLLSYDSLNGLLLLERLFPEILHALPAEDVMWVVSMVSDSYPSHASLHPIYFAIIVAAATNNVLQTRLAYPTFNQCEELFEKECEKIKNTNRLFADAFKNHSDKYFKQGIKFYFLHRDCQGSLPELKTGNDLRYVSCSRRLTNASRV